MKLYHSLTFVLLAISVTCFAQKDTSKTAAPNTPRDLDRSIKGEVFINGGIGESTIYYAVYGIGAGENQSDPISKSESLVYTGAIDYGIGKWLAIGAGVAYQTMIGYPLGSQYTDYTENISRLNVAARFLFDGSISRHFEVYCGLRSGVSFWTDVVDFPPHAANTNVQPTISGSNLIRPSIQVLYGVKLFAGPVGIHAEFAIGTPYLIEGGVTIKILTK